LRVEPYAFIDVRGGANVQRLVAALQNVDPCHTTTMPSSEAVTKEIDEGFCRRLWRGPLDSLRSLGALDLTRRATSEPNGSPERAGRGRVEWCERGDSNPHDLAIASPSSWCVCQFRHFR